MAKQSTELIDIEFINSLKSLTGMPYEKQCEIASNLLKWLHNQNAKINDITPKDGSTILRASVLLTAIQMSPEHRNWIDEVFDDHLKAFFNELVNKNGSPLKYFTNRLLLSSNGYQHIEEAIAYWKLFYPNEKLHFNTRIDSDLSTDRRSFIHDESAESYRKISSELSNQKITTVESIDSDSNDYATTLTKAIASQNRTKIGFRRPSTPLSVIVISDDDRESISKKSRNTDNEPNDGSECRAGGKRRRSTSPEFDAAYATAALEGTRTPSIEWLPENPNLESITSPAANEFDSDSSESETIEAKARILLNEIFALQLDDIGEAINRCFNIGCASISFPIFLAILNRRFPVADSRESFIFLAEMNLRLLRGDESTNTIGDIFLNELFKPPNFNALLKMLHDSDFRYSFFTFLSIALRTFAYGDSILYVIDETLRERSGSCEKGELEIRQALRREIRKNRIPSVIVDKMSEWHFLQSTKETIEFR